MKKKIDIGCLLISAAPILVLLLFYNRLGEFAYTKPSGGNGMIVSKNVFSIVIILVSISWYYLSAYLAKALSGVNVIVNNLVLRISINLLFSALTILLIASNL